MIASRDQTSFHQFVSGIVANGGGDTPEDIMGALKVTLSTLSWRSGVNKVSVVFVFCSLFLYFTQFLVINLCCSFKFSLLPCV